MKATFGAQVAQAGEQSTFALNWFLGVSVCHREPAMPLDASPASTAAALTAVRSASPLCLCLTNFVS